MSMIVCKRMLVLCLLVSVACLGTAQAKPKKVKNNSGSNSAWRIADKKLDRRIDALEAMQGVPGPEGPQGPPGPPGPPGPSGDDGNVAELEARVAALEQLVEQQYAALQAMLGCIHPSSNSMDMIFDGCNVHVRNGGELSDSANSFGNLIIGYNEDSGGTSRIGSHNLVIGPGHSYNGNNGIVAGQAGGNNALLNLSPSDGRLDLSAGEIGVAAEQDIEIETDFGDLSLASQAGDIELKATQRIELTNGGSELTLEAAKLIARSIAVDIDGVASVAVEGGSTMVKGASLVNIDGAIVQINGPGKPAARATDLVIVGAGGAGSITTGSPTVLIGE